MPQIGSFTLLLALSLAVYSFVAGALALYRKDDRLGETARRAGIACWAAVTIASMALVLAAFGNDFSVAYILHHSNRDLPIAYKFAALWSGQEGSLLLWAWLLSSYGLVMRLRYKVDPQLTAYASAIIAAVQVFFLLLVNFAAHPFGLVAGTIPPDGNGLNPLLQYPEMVIHPPMLYLGYVGVTAPFAFALGALIMKYPGEKWIHITRRWTMVAWLFLTCGVFLGAHWAYAVLGWGGYWGWDPVENASILPWLTMTAFLHSVMMQEKRGMMKMWNMWLIFTTFLLAVFGTFLTRSGVVSSVHAFAQSGIGIWFVWFLALAFATCVFFFVRNRETLKSEHRLDSLISRESSFLFNNLVLLVACFAVLWGTLFPVLSEWVTGSKVTVGPPFFNRVNVPIGLFLIFLTGIGPLLAWRQTSWDSLRRNFLWPTMVGVGTAIALIAGGMRPWQDSAYFYSLMALSLAALVTATIVGEFWRGGRVLARQQHINVLSGMVQITRRNTRRYGGYIVHFGMVLIIIGFAGLPFNQDKEQEMGFGDKMQIGGYTLVCQSYTQDDTPNYGSEWAVLDVYKNGKKIDTMFPERRFYKASEQTSTIVANRSRPNEDLYLVYTGKNPDTGKPIIKAHVNPLVMWIWIGVVVTGFGTVLALIPNWKPAKVRAVEKEREAAEAAAKPGAVEVGGD
ncbi:MAG TPA: heme lyase CcmF/NrfE family subunit [Terriglobales bacterium]